MGLSALRIAAVPLAIAFLLPSLSASPAAAPRAVRPTLKFQENYKDRLVRVREDGESWVEESASETYKIKAVIPIDRDVVDISTFGPETRFWFNIGEATYDGFLGQDPRYRAGDRSARVVVDEEEWYDDNDNERVRPITIVNFKWTEEKWTIQVVQRPYKDYESWEDNGFWLVAPLMAYPEQEAEYEPVYPIVERFSEALEEGAYFLLGDSAMGFDAQYSGVAKLRNVVIGPRDEGEEFELGSARLRGTGSAIQVSEDEIDPALELDPVEERRDEAGVLEGLHVSGFCLDYDSGIYAVTARVDGGSPMLLTSFDLWFIGITDAFTYSNFDRVVPVTSPSGTIAITVFDMARNSKTITISY